MIESNPVLKTINLENREQALRELRWRRTEFQHFVTLANLAGDKELAHQWSRALCHVMSLVFHIERAK